MPKRDPGARASSVAVSPPSPPGDAAPRGAVLPPGVVPGAQSVRRELKKRAVSAYQAYLCCKNAGLRHQQAWLQLADTLEEWFTSRPSTALVTLPRGIPIEEAVLAGRFLFPGRLWLGPDIRNLVQTAFPKTQEELQLLTSTVRTSVGAKEKEVDRGCLRCVRKNLFGQSKKRRRGKFASKDDANKMRIRVPHR